MKTSNYSPVFEAVLRQAIRDNIYEEAESVPTEEVLATMFSLSEKHDARMRRLCRREDRKESFRSIIHITKRAAVVAMVTIALLFTVLMANPTVRAVIHEVIIEWYEQFTRFKQIRDNESAEPSEISGWVPIYVPEGYVEVDSREGDISFVVYENENSDFLFFKYSRAGSELLVDNEDKIYSTQEIAGIKYHIFATTIERKPNMVIWFHSNYSFDITGYMDLEILMEMAKSVAAIGTEE